MNILQSIQQLRDDIKTWVTNNLHALNAKIDEKTIPIDSELSATSTNPVQNKVVAKAINNIPRFSGDYNDLTNAPDIVEDESGNMIITDESGNIIFKADESGMHTTALTLKGQNVEDIINTKVAALVDSAPETLNTLNELAEALGDDPNFATSITTEIGKKIDKVEGKGLSTNDFTDEHKTRLEGLGNVDNTSDLDKPVSTATQTAINELREELIESIVSENTEWKIVDASGNIIAQIDANGLETTAVNAQVMKVNGVDVQPVIPVTTSDNGKFLRVVDGTWTAATVPNAEEATF